MRIVFLVLTFLVWMSTSALATTYWVSTGGGSTVCADVDGDNDPGVYMTLTQIDTSNCATSGDTVMFKAGTYTGTHKYMDTLFVSPSGTSASARTKVLCEGDQTCTIAFNSASLGGNISTGGQNVRYFQIGDRGHGFISDCVNGGSTCYGIRFNLPSSTGGAYLGNVVRGNRIRNYHRNGISGREHDFNAYFDGMEVSWNVVEGGVTPEDSGDGTPHSIYVNSVNAIVEYNDVTTGSDALGTQFALHCFHLCDGSIFRYNIVRMRAPSRGFISSHGDAARLSGSKVQVYGNIFKAISGTPTYCVGAYGNGTPIDVYNNVFDGCTNGYDQSQFGGTHSATNIKNNVSTSATVVNCDISAGACTSSNNTTSAVAATHFKDSANGDYSLKSGSALIGAGTSVGFSCNGTCDIGAYETSTYSSAAINEAFLDVTIGQNVANLSPVIPTSTGWSAGCTGSDCGTPIVNNAALLTGTSNVVRLTITGIGGSGVCIGGQTWTVSYNDATGSTTDSALRGGSVNQELMTFTTQAVTNSCGAAPPPPPAGATISYNLNENTGTSAADSEVGDGAQNGTLTNTPAWIAPGKSGTSAVGFTAVSNQYIAIPYGSGVNPTTTSMTDCMWVKPTVAADTRVFFGSETGTNQRYYMGFIGSSLSLGIQASTQATNVDFPVATGTYVRACVRLDSAADTATLFMNGVRGTSAQSVKAYTSFTLSTDLRLGSRIPAGADESGGTTIDEYRHYNVALSDAEVLEDYQNAEPPPPPASGTLTQTNYRFYAAKTDFLGALIPLTQNNNTNITIAPGGAFAVVLQTDCTAANCSSLAQQYRYSCSSCPGSAGVYIPIPDTATADKISFFGELNETGLLSGAVTCCLSGALTANDGGTQHTSSAVPVYQLNQNASVVQRPLIRIEYGATPGWQYCFRAYDQSGNALDAYSQTACVTVVAPFASGGGF